VRASALVADLHQTLLGDAVKEDQPAAKPDVVVLRGQAPEEQRHVVAVLDGVALGGAEMGGQPRMGRGRIRGASGSHNPGGCDRSSGGNGSRSRQQGCTHGTP
jgi:hypothetical protein